MNFQDVFDVLRKYIEERILDTTEVTLGEDTPLLEWGILNSLSTTRLTGFIREHFGVEVPIEEMVGDNFRDLRSIGALVVRLGTR